ncbi:hypothetical protein, partial [Actinomadura logoneensis]|uniref:hypothetical protein n=1 Tax=Actinomadura logoneensis TaxID=2293572 RepID=UPI0018F1DA56
MSTAIMVVVAVVVVVAVIAAALLASRQARTRRLRRRFGPEYDRAVERHGGKAAAERELTQREHRHEELPLRELDPGRRELYRGQWTQVQEQFVDAPEAALEQADRLVKAVMNERGYPDGDFEDRAADLSVEHARALDHYRRGREIRLHHGREKATTEDLRQAMVHYRTLFEDLVADPAERRADGTAGAHADGRAHGRTEERAEERAAARAEEPVAGRPGHQAAARGPVADQRG